MRLASFNVENLFDRARVMNMANWKDGAGTLADFAELNGILARPQYGAADKKQIAKLLKSLGLEKSDESQFVILRQNHGRLVKRGRNGLEVVANGRSDWIGWLELQVEAVDETATQNTGCVIGELGADVLGLVEAESRPALLHFAQVLKAAQAAPYEHIMLIDGNDDRGIDVGIMTRQNYPILDMRSHVDDVDPHGRIFSRDCAHYVIALPGSRKLVVLMNHFKSKGYGDQRTSDEKRERQAERVAEIYKGLRRDGIELVAVMGDFNDFPASPPLQPLLAQTDMKDISTHPRFDDGGFPGTFGSCGATNKIDFILLSPDLMQKVQRGGIFRKGLWPGKRPKKWEVYPSITEPIHAASDHAAIWADIDLA
jgi:endonuclease/exonuclease/phosphatase family metal-dependent hydrolase